MKKLKVSKLTNRVSNSRKPQTELALKGWALSYFSTSFLSPNIKQMKGDPLRKKNRKKFHTIEVSLASKVQYEDKWYLEETVRQVEQKFSTDLRTIAEILNNFCTYNL